MLRNRALIYLYIKLLIYNQSKSDLQTPPRFVTFWNTGFLDLNRSDYRYEYISFDQVSVADTNVTVPRMVAGYIVEDPLSRRRTQMVQQLPLGID